MRLGRKFSHRILKKKTEIWCCNDAVYRILHGWHYQAQLPRNPADMTNGMSSLQIIGTNRLDYYQNKIKGP